MNSAQLHLEIVVRKDEESETQRYRLKVNFCLKYQNTKILKLDCREGWKFLGTEQQPEENLKTVFSE
jgi:hypothetical protein